MLQTGSDCELHTLIHTFPSERPVPHQASMDGAITAPFFYSKWWFFVLTETALKDYRNQRAVGCPASIN